MASYREHLGYLSKHGVATQNRFEVLIPVPSMVQNGLMGGLVDAGVNAGVIETIRTTMGGQAQTARGLAIMCEKAPIPGKNIMTAEHRYNGDYMKMPYGVTYDDQEMVFHSSGDMYEKQILDGWANMILDYRQHQVAYLDDIASTITISQLDRRDNVIYSVNLIDAYPIMINSVNLDNNMINSVQRITVSFAFKRWEPVQVTSGNGAGVADDLMDTPFGPMIGPVLNNPAVQRGLDFLEQQSGVDFEGEAVNVYNQVNEIVKNTTGESINQNVALIESIRAQTENNDNLSTAQQQQVIDVIDQTVNRMRG